MVAKDDLKIADGTGESIGGEAIEVGVVGEGLQLARLVFSVGEGRGGFSAESLRVKAKSTVEEVVDGNDVGVPLFNGVLDVGGGGRGYGVADASVVLTGQEGARCYGGGEREGCGKGLHGFDVGLVIGFAVFEMVLM